MVSWQSYFYVGDRLCIVFYVYHRFRPIICKVISFKNLKYLIIIYLFLGICKLYYFGHFNEILEQCCTWGTHICIHTVNTRVGDNSGRVFFEVPRCMSLTRYSFIYFFSFFENFGFFSFFGFFENFGFFFLIFENFGFFYCIF